MLNRSLLMRIARLWTAAIVIGSFLPVKVKEAVGTETRSTLSTVQRRAAVRHRAGHLIAFGMAAFLFAAASIRNSQRVYYFLFLAALGSAIEYSQYKIFGSVFEWWDIRDDTLAAVAGSLLGSFVETNLGLNLAKKNAETQHFRLNKD